MKKERFVSLKIKMTVGVILICLLIGSFAVFSVNRLASDIIDREYRSRAEQISEAVAITVDDTEAFELTNAVLDIYNGVDEVVPSSEWGSDRWNAYMSNYVDIEKLPVFIKLRDTFRSKI